MVRDAAEAAVPVVPVVRAVRVVLAAPVVQGDRAVPVEQAQAERVDRGVGVVVTVSSVDPLRATYQRLGPDGW